MTQRLGARELLRLLLDDAQLLPGPSRTPDPLGWDGYVERLEELRSTTEVDEAVLVARGTVTGSGVEAIVAAWEFGFLGGSMGVVVGERLAEAFELATSERLPLVLAPSTGGARMQEGMASLVQMAKTTVASTRHARAGLLQVAVLRDPTTGGVFASHANLADVLFAQPGATIGFAGPRVAEAMTGGPLPDASHTAEGARAAGLVDEVVAIDDLPGRLARLLGWPGTPDPVELAPPDGDRTPPGDAWTQVERARSGDRAGTAAFLDAVDVAAELHGDRAGDDDPAIRVGLARVAGRPAIVVGMDRAPTGGRITPAGYRKAWRGVRLAGRLGVPVITLIDTPGADASASSEAGGIAHHIARTFVELLDVPTPTVALVIGEGGSGGALALSVTDRLLIQEHAVFTVLRPEGAAAILHQDADQAPQVAGRLQPAAADLERLGIADEVVAEPRGAEVDAGWAAVVRHLDELADTDTGPRLDRRRHRWRTVCRPADAGGSEEGR